MKQKYSAVILKGPPVAYWSCPSCGTKIKNLNSCGKPNRIATDIDNLALKHPTVRTHFKYVLNKLPEETCMECYLNTEDLLGSLSVSYGKKGSFLKKDGDEFTFIIGAILPSSDFGEALVSLFHMYNGEFVLAEECPLSKFDLRRITIPLAQGKIHKNIWKLYQERIDSRNESWVHLNARMVNAIY